MRAEGSLVRVLVGRLSRVAPPGYALLETTGRKTGMARRTPVGDGWVGYQFWLVAEHGMKADYVRNIAAEPTRTAEIASWDSGPLAYGKSAGVTRR